MIHRCRTVCYRFSTIRDFLAVTRFHQRISSELFNIAAQQPYCPSVLSRSICAAQISILRHMKDPSAFTAKSHVVNTIVAASIWNKMKQSLLEKLEVVLCINQSDTFYARTVCRFNGGNVSESSSARANLDQFNIKIQKKRLRQF
jgi:hypothetical protein